MKKAAVFVTLTTMMHSTALYASRPFISLLASANGADSLQIGYITAAYSVVQAGFALVISGVLDRRGFRPTVLFGSALFALACAGLACSVYLWQIAASTMLMGLAHGLVLLSGQYAMTGIGDEAVRDRWVGYYIFANSVGFFIGPTIGGFLMDSFGYGRGFLGASAISLLGACAALACPNYRSGRTQDRSGLASLLLDRDILRNIAVSGAVFFAVDIINIYLPLYGAECGLSAAAVGMVLSANGIAQMSIRPFLGALVQRLTKYRAFMVCMIAGGTGLALLGVARGFWPLMAVSVFVGLTVGLANPLTLLTVADVATPETRSRVLALRVMFNYVGQTASPIAFGALASVLGLWPVFWCSGAMLIACSAAAKKPRTADSSDAQGMH